MPQTKPNLFSCYYLFRKSKEQCNHLETKLKQNRSDYVSLEIKTNEYQTKVIELERRIAQYDNNKIDSESKIKSLENASQTIEELSMKLRSETEEKLKISSKCSEYSADLRLISDCLNESENEVASTNEDGENVLKKINQLKQMTTEYNRVLSILRNNGISIDKTENIENAIIELQQQNKLIKEQLQQITAEYT